MIRLTGVKKSYGKGENKNQVLKGIDLCVQVGEFVVVTGASGSGKSTLLNVASGLERADAGSVEYDGRDIERLSDKERTRFRRQNVGFVFQQYYLLPHVSVEKNVQMGTDLVGNRDYLSLIEAVGLLEKRKKKPTELSGGERQRVSIARALAKKPKVLFLDEPTGALDEGTGRQVLSLIERLQREGKFTVVMITHNQNVADMAIMMFVIGLALAFMSLFLSLSELVKGNAESLALLKAFGYTGRERCFSVFGGYLPFSAIGFAVGTLYQWGLLKIMITFVFREMEEVPAYTFDVKGLFLSLTAFVAVYGVILWWYILKAQRASLKVVMSEI